VDKLSDWFSLIKKARVSAEGGGAIDGVCHARLLLPRAGGVVANDGRGHASAAATWAASAEAPGLRRPPPSHEKMQNLILPSLILDIYTWLQQGFGDAHRFFALVLTLSYGKGNVVLLDLRNQTFKMLLVVLKVKLTILIEVSIC